MGWHRLPQGLQGEQIPLFGRIVAIADVFDALVNRRPPIQEALPVSQALAIMTEEQGRHFDPNLLDCFLQQQFEILKVMELYADERGAMTDASPL